ncbi:MAG: type II toxin-antitoxin system Phd/YefM family antitoxin [Gammaproteobacteria bacterium]
MQQIINIQETETLLAQLLQRIEAGDEIVLAKADKPVARLVAYREPAKRRLGEAKGLVEIMPDFDVLPADFMEHFE